MKCKNGHENPEGAQFCKDCGSPIIHKEKLKIISYKSTIKKIKPVTRVSFFMIIVVIPLFATFVISYNLLVPHKLNLLENRFTERFETIKLHLPSECPYIQISNLDDLDKRDALNKYLDNDVSLYLIGLADNYERVEDLFDLFEILSFISGYMLFICISIFIASFFIYHFRWKQFNNLFPYHEAKEKLSQFIFIQNSVYEKFKIRENTRGDLQIKDKSLKNRGCFHLVKGENGEAILIGEKYNSQSLIREVFGKNLNFIEK